MAFRDGLLLLRCFQCKDAVAALGAPAQPAAAAGRRALCRPNGRLADVRPLVLPHVRSDDMTHPSTRRTVLATGAAALAAGYVGCSKHGDENSGASPSANAPSGRKLAATSDIPVGGGKVFTDQKVVVTQPKKDEFKAFSAICTHEG